MDKDKMIKDIDKSITALHEEICKFTPENDKIAFSFRHILIMKRNRLIELIGRLENGDGDVDDLINRVNTKIQAETDQLLSNIT